VTTRPRERGREIREGWAVGTGDGCCQGLIAWGNEWDLYQGTEWEVRRGEVSRKQSGLCL